MQRYLHLMDSIKQYKCTISRLLHLLEATSLKLHTMFSCSWRWGFYFDSPLKTAIRCEIQLSINSVSIRFRFWVEVKKKRFSKKSDVHSFPLNPNVIHQPRRVWFPCFASLVWRCSYEANVLSPQVSSHPDQRGALAGHVKIRGTAQFIVEVF